ncbi:MAG: hypothetical protein ACFE9Q_07055 [Candidatus Hodarchaeota archaeon]
MENLKIGHFLMNFMGFYILIIGILWIFVTEIMFVSDFLWYTGESYPSYLASNPIYAEIYIITKKLIGFVLLANGILVLFINNKSYKNGEKWSWFALLLSGGLTWGTFIGYKIFIGYYGGSMITFVIGAGLLVAGLAFPSKEILGKK